MGLHGVGHDLAAQQQRNFHYSAVQRLGLEREMSYGNLRTFHICIPVLWPEKVILAFREVLPPGF